MTSPASSTSSFAYLRVRVIHLDAQFLYVQRENSAESTTLTVNYGPLPQGGPDWSYLQQLLGPGSLLNLIRPVVKDGILYPEHIIFQPDYLINISAIAACFQKFGNSPYLFLIQKVRPNPESTAIMLGNLAGMLLDKELQQGPTPLAEDSFEQVRQAFFQRYTLPLAVCTSAERHSLYEQARIQQQMLRQILAGAQSEWPFVPEKALLEPSFFCEMLGLQGRMDLLQEDKTILMEQKSGKKDEFRNRPVKGHYVQMILYLALLHYAFDIPFKDIHAFLLYSKYPDGLLLEENNEQLLFEALRLRNQIVWNEYQFCNGGVQKVWERLTADRFNSQKRGGRLWDEFQKPKYEQLLQTVQQAPSLEKAYFYRFFTFTQKELMYAKIGTPAQAASGFAATWNSSAQARRQEGNLIDQLYLEPPVASSTIEGEPIAIEVITLRITHQEDDYLPNFRISDQVITFPYPQTEVPDIRADRVLRGTVSAIGNGQISVTLTARQQNRSIFEKPQPQWQWAVVHDFMEVSFSFLFQTLFAFLQMDAHRRDLLLCRRTPETVTDAALALHQDYSQNGNAPERNLLVQNAIRAKELFLVVGPPGTGKTSFALMHILQETLAAQPDASVLLTAYTNRAVDEICSKLDKAGLDYLRFGNAGSCASAHHSHLVDVKMAALRDESLVCDELQKVRIFTGTLSALSRKPQLFYIKHFALAIIDEASQILEPQVLFLFNASDRQGQLAIDKFVLIGDQKQLPAIVQQSVAESTVQEQELTAIGLTDCRRSLFERWYNIYKDNPQVVFELNRQGRMHPHISHFPSLFFYRNRLQCVPLPHQQENATLWSDAPSPTSASETLAEAGNDPLQSLLATRRLVFIPSQLPDEQPLDKVNWDEAHRIARCLQLVWEIRQNSGLPFQPGQSIGVIVPYRHQIAAVTRAIEQDIPKGLCRRQLSQIAIDTVERYQGSERDTIIYGFTVSKPYQLEFLTNQVYQEEGPDGQLIDRKLNVILTRARQQLILVGNPDLLNTVPLYRRLIDYIQST